MRLFMPALLLSLTACGAGPVGGVWLFSTTPAPTTCASTVTSNLNDAETPDPETSDWTDIEEENLSPRTFAAHIAHGAKGEVTLIAGGSILRGEKVEGKTYAFRFERDDEVTDGQEHSSGYRYVETEKETINLVYTLTLTGGDTIEGTVETEVAASRRFEESDEWDEEIGSLNGDLPAFYVGVNANIGNESDCAAATCFIEVTEDCTADGTITGVRTGFDGSADFQIDGYEG